MANEVNERIAIYRRLTGLSQEQVADLLGMSSSTYSQKERKGNITVEFVKRVAPILKVEPSAIMFGEENIITPPEPKQPTPEIPTPFPPNATLMLLNNSESSLINICRNLPKTKRQKVLQFASIFLKINKRSLRRNRFPKQSVSLFELRIAAPINRLAMTFFIQINIAFIAKSALFYLVELSEPQTRSRRRRAYYKLRS